MLGSVSDQFATFDK